MTVIKQMDMFPNRNTATKQTNNPEIPKRFYRKNISTLEYGIIANLVTQQYQQGDAIKWDALLSIPLSERIPGLMESYGKKTMHKLLVMILTEFSNSLVLTRAKKLTETKISVAACELMISAYEDFLSLEDVILFLQRAKAGRYGIIKNMSHTTILFSMLEKYRQARHEAYTKMQEEKNQEYKAMGDHTRTANEPTDLNSLLHQAFVIDISNRA